MFIRINRFIFLPVHGECIWMYDENNISVLKREPTENKRTFIQNVALALRLFLWRQFKTITYEAILLFSDS